MNCPIDESLLSELPDSPWQMRKAVESLHWLIRNWPTTGDKRTRAVLNRLVASLVTTLMRHHGSGNFFGSTRLHKIVGALVDLCATGVPKLNDLLEQLLGMSDMPFYQRSLLGALDPSASFPMDAAPLDAVKEAARRARSKEHSQPLSYTEKAAINKVDSVLRSLPGGSAPMNVDVPAPPPQVLPPAQPLPPFRLTKTRKGADEKARILGDIRKRVEGNTSLPETARAVITEQYTRLSGLEMSNDDFAKTRDYLDWLTQIPWGKYSPEQMDPDAVLAALNETHYGQDGVKREVMMLVAAAQQAGSMAGKTICLAGPPGVGKTAFAESIAHALGRPFFNFSAGGKGDTTFLTGHPRTYIGSIPGSLITALKKTGRMNPVICIDEIDKLGRARSGDPSATFLEILNPDQNRNFIDAYLETPVDLSRVLFICTANYLRQISEPLLDRMEVIELPPYTREEKVHIAKTHFIPQQRKQLNMGEEKVGFGPGVVEALVDRCEEPGVRKLKEKVSRAFREAALTFSRTGTRVQFEVADAASF